MKLQTNIEFIVRLRDCLVSKRDNLSASDENISRPLTNDLEGLMSCFRARSRTLKTASLNSIVLNWLDFEEK